MEEEDRLEVEDGVAVQDGVEVEDGVEEEDRGDGVEVEDFSGITMIALLIIVISTIIINILTICSCGYVANYNYYNYSCVSYCLPVVAIVSYKHR